MGAEQDYQRLHSGLDYKERDVFAPSISDVVDLTPRFSYCVAGTRFSEGGCHLQDY